MRNSDLPLFKVGENFLPCFRDDSVYQARLVDESERFAQESVTFFEDEVSKFSVAHGLCVLSFIVSFYVFQ